MACFCVKNLLVFIKAAVFPFDSTRKIGTLRVDRLVGCSKQKQAESFEYTGRAVAHTSCVEEGKKKLLFGARICMPAKGAVLSKAARGG